MSLFLLIVVASLFNAGVMLLAKKWGVTDYYIAKRMKWMPEHCEFCTCFWMSVFEMVFVYLLVVVNFDLWSFLMIAVFALCSAVLSRFVI